MTEEIKEILDDYKKLAGEITEKLDNTAEYESWLIIQDYVDEFINYITNLQKENEELKENNKRKTSRCTERNHRIRARDRIIERRNKKINKLEDYKQRNEKAIEYIENDMPYLEEPDDDYENNHKMQEYDKTILLNILQGGDE